MGTSTGDDLWHMEDILTLYEEPYRPDYPVLCVDERPCPLLGEVVTPLPMHAGRSRRQDYEYIRQGTCCILRAFEPRRGWRFLQVLAHRTAQDYARFMRELVTTYSPMATKIRLVQDNLNTPTPGAFYTVFPPEEAFALAQKFELHYTPLKGSWLNMAEIEFSALVQQCLDRRIGDITTLTHEATLWASQRNQAQQTVRWHFTPSDARRKLGSKYPVIQN